MCILPLAGQSALLFRTLSEGLSVRLNKIHDGRFELFNQQQDNNEDYPLLELVRCPYCGTLLAKASGSVSDHNYQPVRNEDRVDILICQTTNMMMTETMIMTILLQTIIIMRP